MSSVATVIAGPDTRLTPATLKALSEVLQSNDVMWLEEGKAADILCSLPPAVIYDTLKAGGQPFDIIAQPADDRRKKFLIADMESTMIEQEMLDELAAMVGVGEEVAAATRRSMNGEVDFKTSLRQRVALLKGQPASLIDEAAKLITFMPGAEALLGAMKKAGAECWLVSGGFTCFAKPVAERLGFDRCYANELTVRDGVITGELAEPIQDRYGKREHLEQGCRELGLPLSATLAVGDGANDVLMLEACNVGGGLGVAYRAKPYVRQTVPHQINAGDLNALVYAQGLPSPL